MFVGAGGYALRLLQRSGIAEAKGYGGFPIGGKFLRSSNPVLAAAHRAKVYGFPAQGAPRMSAPHLDTRIVNGKPWLMFGPFVGWTPKFLKQGDVTDLLESVTPGNVPELLSVGITQRESGELPGCPVGALGPTESRRYANSHRRQWIPTGARSPRDNGFR